jgi:hypothetical protein
MSTEFIAVSKKRDELEAHKFLSMADIAKERLLGQTPRFKAEESVIVSLGIQIARRLIRTGSKAVLVSLDTQSVIPKDDGRLYIVKATIRDAPNHKVRQAGLGLLEQQPEIKAHEDKLQQQAH